MIAEPTHTGNAAIVGLLWGCSAAAIGINRLFPSRVTAEVSVGMGASPRLLILGLMPASSVFGSISLFLGWCVVGGILDSFVLVGGLGPIN